MKPPVKPKLGSALTRMTEIVWADDLQLTAAEALDVAAAGPDARRISFDETRLERFDFGQRAIRQLSLIDVDLRGCLMIGLGADGSLWRRVEVSGVQGSGLVASDATFEDVTFDACKLEAANFRVSKLRNVRFTGCILDAVDFSGSHLTNVRFEGCQLGGATFDHAQLTNVDLRGSQLSGVNGLDGLRGATLTTAQAVRLSAELAQHLGIKLED